MPRPGSAPPAPFIAPMAGELDQRLATIADAISRKADVTSMPTYAGVHLIAPDGSTWMLSIDNTGALHTEQLMRT